VPLLENETGVRPIALGNAYMGLADDGSGIFTNPAGLAALNKMNLTSYYYTAPGDISFAAVGGVWPGVLGGTVGIGYRNRSQANVLVSTETVTAADQDFIFTYLKCLRPNISVSGDLRYVVTGYSKDVAGYESLYGGGLALGAGLKYQPRPGLGLGLDVKNFTGQISYKNGATDNLPLRIAVGASLKVLGENGLRQYQKHSLLMNFDLSKNSDFQQYLLHLGLEWEPVEILAVRFGINQTPNGISQTYNDLTFGVGLKYAGVTFDYAQYRRSDPTQAVTQYFSLGYVGVKEKKPASPEAAAVAIVTPEAASLSERAGLAKVKLVKFKDVPKNHWARAEIEQLATAGLLRGYPNRTFQPNKKVTRREFETMVSSARQLPPTLVPEPDKLVSRREAFRRLDLTGQLDRPNDPLTRAEAAIFFSKTSFGEAAIKRLPPLEP